MYYPKLKKEILLTGAGFSASVGGYLAFEMWAKLFNHPSLTKTPKVKAMMRNHEFKFDYERIYHEIVMENSLTTIDPEAKTVVKEAMYDAMRDLVTQVQDHRRYQNHLNVRQLKALIKFFAGDSNAQGVIFTTNQDIFMETLARQGPHAVKHMIHVPGIQEYPYGREKVLIPENTLALEQVISKQIFSQDPYLSYCKLHGSWAWQYAGSIGHAHITGLNKLDAIRKEPLLNWYYELFKQALNRSDVRLLIVGYGFTDPHINEVIRNGIKEYGLKVCVIDPKSPIQFNTDFIHPKGSGHNILNHQEIWDGFEAYLPYTLQRVFPPSKEYAALPSPAKDLNRLFSFMERINDPDVKFDLSQ